MWGTVTIAPQCWHNDKQRRAGNLQAESSSAESYGCKKALVWRVYLFGYFKVPSHAYPTRSQMRGSSNGCFLHLQMFQFQKQIRWTALSTNLWKCKNKVITNNSLKCHKARKDRAMKSLDKKMYKIGNFCWKSSSPCTMTAHGGGLSSTLNCKKTRSKNPENLHHQIGF